MKNSHTYYYVQSKENGKLPEIVYHSKDGGTGEYYYKFLNKQKALDLLNYEKKITPNVQFRLVKLVESYMAGEWV